MQNNYQIKTECSLCQTKIWQMVNGKLRKSSEYNEVTVEMNDNSLMKVGVCNEHKKPLGTQLVDITNKVHQGWIEEVALGIGNNDWVQEKGLKLAVIGVQ